MLRGIAIGSALLATLGSSLVSAECWRDTPCDGPQDASFSGPWENSHFAPTTRTLAPKRVLDANLAQLDTWPAQNAVSLSGNGTLINFDWQLEVGGVVTIGYTANGVGTLGIAFSESSNFTGYISDESNGGNGHDGALFTDIDTQGSEQTLTYVVPDDRARGGFRYMSLYTLTNSTLDVSIQSIQVELSFHPNWGNLQAYGGYFYSSDPTLNAIWYAGAYSIQTNIMATNTARVYPCLDNGWENNADLATQGPGLAAGNKRDRAVWAGDLGMAIRSGKSYESVKPLL